MIKVSVIPVEISIQADTIRASVASEDEEAMQDVK